ncbi:hypothetical protein PMAG_a3902 [Pseudoalteromonas mariniglutinosa NCIMB 1770]|nr:hypothetical protein [Pseudoalteromonas mariniglutinosa NCIMB 1770]
MFTLDLYNAAPFIKHVKTVLYNNFLFYSYIANLLINY